MVCVLLFRMSFFVKVMSPSFSLVINLVAWNPYTCLLAIEYKVIGEAFAVLGEPNFKSLCSLFILQYAQGSLYIWVQWS